MPAPPGIRTLEHLRERCVEDDITGCWLFQVTRKPNRLGDWGANVWLPDLQRTETLQRAGWILAGRPLGKARDWTVWRTCHNSMCGNPQHLRAGPRQALGRWLEGTGRLRGDPARSLINRRNKIASGMTRITQELADWIRESDQTGVDIACALEVSTHCVSRVRTGKTWTRTVQGSSVFAWAGGR